MNSKSDGKEVNPAAAPGHPEQRWWGSGWSFAVVVAAEVALGVVAQRLVPQAAPAQIQAPFAAQQALPPATGKGERLSPAERVARWAVAGGDAGRRPYVIVDKPNARVMAFDAQGRMTHSAPALLGLTRGDDSPPGIGEKPIPLITPEERVTPAGRFVAQLGRNLSGEDIVWVDYGAAVSMHRVRATKASERRLERLASKQIDDNRISYGCINLPVAFYEKVLQPMVQAGPTVVYVLPDRRPLEQVFALNSGH